MERYTERGTGFAQRTVVFFLGIEKKWDPVAVHNVEITLGARVLSLRVSVGV